MTGGSGCPLVAGCPVDIRWSPQDKSHEVVVNSPTHVTFHPNWSNGTAGVRAERPLDPGLIYYWEVHIPARLFGTSMQVGVATKKASLHADQFLNLLGGQDSESWGLSHKGLTWHGQRNFNYCRPFRENVACTVGVLLDMTRGTIKFYKDGEDLGLAFTGLDQVDDPLYPAVASSAAKTEMMLLSGWRTFSTLQDRCRQVVVNALRRAAESSANNDNPVLHSKNEKEAVAPPPSQDDEDPVRLHRAITSGLGQLPKRIKSYLLEEIGITVVHHDVTHTWEEQLITAEMWATANDTCWGHKVDVRNGTDMD